MADRNEKHPRYVGPSERAFIQLLNQVRKSQIASPVPLNYFDVILTPILHVLCQSQDRQEVMLARLSGIDIEVVGEHPGPGDDGVQ